MTFVRGLAALLFLLLFSGFSPASAQDGVETAAKRAAAAKVKPGDQVALHFLRDPSLSATVTVNERGEAAFPKLGLMSVSQMSIAELQDTLRSRYAEYLRSPELEVAVLRRIVVNGEVKLPNVFQADGATTLRDLIARAGGITENGSRGKVWVIRDGVQIPAKGWESDQGISTNLQSGDQILVGRKNWLVINLLPVVSTGVLVAGLINTVMR
jgi:polysaccharide export outer membrane protein